jgi:GNAT superfamily N-acetyltransferase
MNAAATDLIIREFVPGDEIAFQRLNQEWISHYFTIEARDAEILAEPERIILEPGGRIFFALLQGEAVGCCALLPSGDRQYEVSKMAVTESCRGLGVGRRLMGCVIAEARVAGARRLYLETNHVLTPAIRLYESLGFRHLPLDRIPHSPYARADVYMELELNVDTSASAAR